MGALVMTHSDDKGLVLPPNLAPIQVVIVPIFKGDDQLDEISEVAVPLKQSLVSQGISVKYDNCDNFKPGYKFNDYELKGVPIRIAIGPRDIENRAVEMVRRDTLEKSSIPLDGISDHIKQTLKDIQDRLYIKALNFREEHITAVNNFEEFQSVLSRKAGFISAHWDGTSATEEAIKKLTKATIRCIPLEVVKEEGVCVYSGKKSNQRVLFAKAY